MGRYPVNGTVLYAEVRGSGPPVLLIHAGGEDAEQWRPLAERLSGFTVVTYDRRGTLRSGRDAWPGGGSAQHADDAAGLLRALGVDDVLVFGASSGGIPALQLALGPEHMRRFGGQLARRQTAVRAASSLRRPGRTGMRSARTQTRRRSWSMTSRS